MLPQDNQERVRLNLDRIKYWLSKGAQPTDRVALFLGKADVIKMPEMRPTPQKSTPKAKAQERMKAEAEAQKAKEEAAKQPVEILEEAPTEEHAAETPAEEAPEVSVEALLFLRLLSRKKRLRNCNGCAGTILKYLSLSMVIIARRGRHCEE